MTKKFSAADWLHVEVMGDYLLMVTPNEYKSEEDETPLIQVYHDVQGTLQQVHNIRILIDPKKNITLILKEPIDGKIVIK